MRGHQHATSPNRCPECGTEAGAPDCRLLPGLKVGLAVVAATMLLASGALWAAQGRAKPVASPAELARRAEDERDKAQAIAAQAECWTYQASPRQVVYEEGPSPAAEALLATPGASRFRSDGAAAVGVVPDCWRRLNAVTRQWQAQATLFLHERRTPDGTPVLLVVEYPVEKRTPAGMAGGGTTGYFNFFAATSPRETPGGRPKQFSFDHVLVRTSPEVTRHPVRFFAGQPDPQDPRHFTVRYELNGGSGTVDGWLLNPPRVDRIGGDIVRMEIRDGPAKAAMD